MVVHASAAYDPVLIGLRSIEHWISARHMRAHAAIVRAQARALRLQAERLRHVAVTECRRRRIAGESRSTSILVAVVDDDGSIVRGLTRLLGAAGFVVKGFASGEDLLAWDELDTLDCAILDINLRGLTGFETQTRLENVRPSLPIVFITARHDQLTAERARRTGSECLSKPFEEGMLIAAIDRSLGRPARRRTA